MNCYNHIYHFWCQRVLPAVYADELSYYEAICVLQNAINTLIKEYEFMNENIDELIKFANDLTEILKGYDKLLKDIANGKYVDLYLKSIINWIDQNLQCLVARIVKMVCFGLDDNGHFVAYIPYSWKFLQFDTGYNYNDKATYGHLILSW